MRRITSLIALLVMMMVSTSVSAQDLGCLDDLKLKTFAISEQVEDIVPNTWYLLYQNRDGGGYFVADTVGTRAYKLPVENIEEGTFYPCKTHARYLVRFIEAESSEEEAEYATYKLQFATGVYVGEDVFSTWMGNTEEATFTDLEDEAALWNVGQFADLGGEGEYEKGHFWFTVDYLGSRIDNDGFSSGKGNLSYWEEGVPSTEKYNQNCDWQVFSIEFGETSELEILYNTVTNRYEALMEQYDAFEVGTGHGQYPEEKVLAFQAALDEVGETLDDPSFDPTLESLQAMLDKMNNAYNDVVNSQIILKLEPANGYYFVKTANDSFYYETVTTDDTEDPETGEIIPGETTTQYFTKAMYCTTDQAGWKTLDEDDATFLFRIDKDETTGNYQFKSAVTGGRIPTIAQSSAFSALDATLDPVESEIKFYYNDQDSLGNIIFAIRRADQSGDYQFLHQNNHSSGAGKSGNFCGWAQTPTASNWRLQLVSDEKANELLEAYAPIREHQELVAKYDSIKAVAQAELPIAEDLTIDKTNALITDASQFSSEWTEPNQGTIEGLCDGDYSTFWHSNWSDGATEMGKHYLQAALPEPQSFGLAMMFVRRDCQNDHPTLFSVYGSTTGTEETKEEWTKLGELKYSDLSRSTELWATILFEGSYQYIRIYPEETVAYNGSSKNNRGYWHAAEINFYPVYNNENSQAAHMGNLYTDLKQVLADQADLTSDDLTKEHYNALKNALDAFNTKFVDPTALRNAITAAQAKAENVVEGTDPGYWSDLSGKTALDTTIGNAQNYDKSGDYTPAQSEEYIKQINDGADALYASANKVSTDKWYYIQFPSEEMYDEYEWDKAGGETKYNDDEQMTMEALFETVMVPGKHRAGLEESEESPSANFVEAIGVDEAYQGTDIVCDLLDDLVDEDLAKFRFIAVGDSAYALQNKATGLYVSMTNGNTYNTIDMQPTLFKVSALGKGTNLLKNEDISGVEFSYLHFQHAGSRICSWNATNLPSNSALLIKEAEDVDAAPANTFLKQIEAGKIYPMCYAASYKVTDGDAALYTVRGINEDLGTYSVVLTPTEEVAAGVPSVLIADGEYVAPGKGEDPMYDEITMEHGTSFVHDPVATTAVRGSFLAQTADKGTIVAEGGSFSACSKSTSVAPRSAYFVYEGGSVESQEGDITIEIGGKGKVVDSIDNVLNKVAANGAIYTIDGRLIRENGNINNVRGLAKGAYIVNGVKVLVK